MKCLLEYDGDSWKRKGYRHYHCIRPGCKNDAHSPYELDRINPPDCDRIPLAHEIGHWIAFLLEVILIRKRDYLWLKAKLGFAPKCGCDQREAALNDLGKLIAGKAN